MFLKKKLSKTAKNTIVKNYGRLKGGGAGARPPPLNTPLLSSSIAPPTMWGGGIKYNRIRQTAHIKSVFNLSSVLCPQNMLLVIIMSVNRLSCIQLRASNR